MRSTTTITIALAAALGATACKKDEGSGDKGKPTTTTTSTTTTTTTSPPTANRPSQGKLPTMPELQLPEDAQRAQKVELGHALFFDKRLSVDGSRSCYSCHMNENGTGGKDPLAIGAGDKPLTRHAPTLWNVAWLKGAFYWDGRSPTLEAQAKAAWAGGNMGVGEDKLDAKVAEIAKIAGYKKLFEAAFPGQKPSPDLVTQAISEYERTLLCKDTAYDKFAAGDKAALTDQQQKGLDVFLGKGMCATCHTPPFFSAAMNVDGGVYFNVGVGTAGKPEDQVDIGRMKVTNAATDWAAFKPPSLRNIAKSAPYFHDGSAATLDDALKVMTTGGIANKNLTALMADRKLTDAEHADLAAFLGALDCEGTLEEPTLP
ncbi:MAG: c-type cytochrome [Myxococcales bacterium]|nr:c-type cytochrome [Myxococcales bacterium]